MPSFLLQTIICRFAPLFGQKGRHLTCLGICPCGGHRRTWMSPVAVYPSLLRQSLSLVLELTVSSGRLAGHHGPAALHLSRRHTVVTPGYCTCRLGAEPRSPGLRTHALACQSFSLPSYLLLNHNFFLIWTCLHQVYFQTISVSLHLDGVVFSFSQVLRFVWKELDFKVGQKDGSLTATYSLILARSSVEQSL